MTSLFQKATLGFVAAGTLAAAATPAEAQRYRHRDRGNGGAVIAAGIAGLAIGAALSSDRRYDYDRRYYRQHGYYPTDGYYYRENYRRYRGYERCYESRCDDPNIGRRESVRYCNWTQVTVPGTGIARASLAKAQAVSDTPPARLSGDPKSPHFDEPLLMRGIGIRFKGVQRRDVEEYCISEGWIKVQLGSKTDRKGQPLTITLKGPVEAWFEAPAPGAQAEEAATGEAAEE